MSDKHDRMFSECEAAERHARDCDCVVKEWKDLARDLVEMLDHPTTQNQINQLVDKARKTLSPFPFEEARKELL